MDSSRQTNYNHFRDEVCSQAFTTVCAFTALRFMRGLDEVMQPCLDKKVLLCTLYMIFLIATVVKVIWTLNSNTVDDGKRGELSIPSGFIAMAGYVFLASFDGSTKWFLDIAWWYWAGYIFETSTSAIDWVIVDLWERTRTVKKNQSKC